jgi:hypothetical protein
VDYSSLFVSHEGTTAAAMYIASGRNSRHFVEENGFEVSLKLPYRTLVLTEKQYIRKSHYGSISCVTLTIHEKKINGRHYKVLFSHICNIT